MQETALVNIRVQRLVVIVAITLFALKLLAYYLTNSIAILTDALEGIVNVISGFTGLYSLRIAAKPRDLDHPYGHGKAELLSASFEAILILVAGVVIIYESLNNLLHPHPLQQLDYGIGIIALTAAINYAMGWHCIKTGKKNNSIALIASGKHLHTDTWTTLGIIGGLLLIYATGIAWLDSAVALVFAVFIIYEGYKIIRETTSGIMDEADLALIRSLVAVLDRHKRDNWIDLHNLRIIKYGSVLHLDCHFTVPWYLNVRAAHREMDDLDHLIRDNFPQSLEMFIHIDDCKPPFSCRVCPIDGCKAREAAFEKRLTWTLENITKNARHGMDEGAL
ncbi:MAG: cation transporter [Saprospiraceae bacterium]|nr:cation transporter [Saprospiraceae bacterium]